MSNVKISQLPVEPGWLLTDVYPLAGGNPFQTYNVAANILLNQGRVGFTGGGASKLDGVQSAAYSLNAIWPVVTGNQIYYYQLQTGTAAQNVPTVIRGYDFDPANNPRVFQLVTPYGTINALTLPAGAGIVCQTSALNFTNRSLVAPAAGITITNPDGGAGNPTFALANDLGALEALSGTGVAVRTATSTWTNLAIAGTSNQITVTNGDGVAGAPTISLPSTLVGVNSITSSGAGLTLAAGTGGYNVTLTPSGAGNVNLSTVTASRLLATDGSSNVIANAALQANGFAYATAAGALASTAAGTNGQLLIGSSSLAPVAATLTGTANQITVTNGAGSITLSLPGGNFTGFANPSATVGLSAVNGSATTALRSDGAPALSQAIVPTWTGVHTFTPAARSSGTAAYLTINAAPDTGITTATESVGLNYVGATRTWVDGTVAQQREILFQAPTYNKTTTSATFTKAATVAIAAAPAGGTGVTITNAYALWVQNGKAQFDGTFSLGSNTLTLTGSPSISGVTITGSSSLAVTGVSAINQDVSTISSPTFVGATFSGAVSGITTISSSYFTTTSTGINATNIGATTPGTGAFAGLTVSSGTLAGLTGLAIRDTSAAFDVTIAATSSTALTAGRTLTLDLVNAARTLKLTGNAVLNQDVSTTGTPTLAGQTISVVPSGSTYPVIVFDAGTTGKGYIARINTGIRIEQFSNVTFSGSVFNLDDTTQYGAAFGSSMTATGSTASSFRVRGYTPGTNPRTSLTYLNIDGDGNWTISPGGSPNVATITSAGIIMAGTAVISVLGGTSPVLTTSSAVTTGAGASVGTLTNAPAAGNPTKWIPINDNGTTRYFPAW